MNIGPYTIEAPVGQGGLGVVYKARSPKGAVVAIKVLRKADNETIARFARERRLQESLGVDAGFVRLLDAGETNGAPWVVMPFLAGGTLRDRMARGPLPLAETIDIARRLARALGEAHSRGIVHRDVKPENVLYASPDAPPLLADLGLAKHFDRAGPGASQSISLSGDGGFCGTAGYMAPEQMGAGGVVGPPADVFALGAVIYECLAGRPAFVGATVLEQLARTMEGRFEPLRPLRPDAPAWLVSAVEKSIALDPRARPADGFALARALSSAGRSRRTAGVAVAALLLVSVAVVALLAARREPVSHGEGVAAPSSLSTVRPSRSDGPTAAALVAEGVRRNSRAEYAKAFDLATRAIAAAPEHADGWALRAVVSIERDGRSTGRDDASRAFALDRSSALTWLAHTAVSVTPEDQREDVERAIAIDPSLPVVWVFRTIVANELRDFEGAAGFGRRAVELDPECVLGYVNRAWALSSLGRHDLALADYDRAVAIATSDARILMLRGVARQFVGEYDRAREDLDRALELLPDDERILRHRAEARLYQDDLQGAIDDATRAIGRNDRNADAWRIRGNARLLRRDLRGAIEDETASIERNGRNPKAYVVRGDARGALGDWEGTVEDTTKAIELDPRVPDPLFFRGNAHSELGRIADARADFKRFLALAASNDPQVPSVRTWLANHPE